MLPKPKEETVLSLLQEDLIFWLFKTLKAPVGFGWCLPSHQGTPLTSLTRAARPSFKLKLGSPVLAWAVLGTQWSPAPPQNWPLTDASDNIISTPTCGPASPKWISKPDGALSFSWGCWQSPLPAFCPAHCVCRSCGTVPCLWGHCLGCACPHFLICCLSLSRPSHAAPWHCFGITKVQIILCLFQRWTLTKPFCFPG